MPGLRDRVRPETDDADALRPEFRSELPGEGFDGRARNPEASVQVEFPVAARQACSRSGERQDYSRPFSTMRRAAALAVRKCVVAPVRIGLVKSSSDISTSGVP